MPSSASSPAIYNSVSILISDDDEPDSFVRKARLQSRRKRKGARHRQKKNEILVRAVRALRRWWAIFLFLAAIALLIFEAVKILGKPHQSVEPELGSVKNLAGNSSRLDPTHHMVNGARDRCLKLLPSEELQNLDIPPVGNPSSPVQKVVYMLESDRSYAGSNTTLLRQHMEVMRFNLFTGYQTLQDREESYEVNETAVTHCGFYSENGGFQVSDEDKSYMQMCEVAVSTCAFGGGDDLYQPIGMTEASVRKVCYVAFWDEVTLQTQELEGRRIDEDHMIGKWRIVVVRQLPFVDQRLNGKIPKMLGHRLFPRARYSIWVDSKSQFRRDPLGVLEALLWRTNSELAISEHGARSSVYDEGKAVVKKNKATPEEVEVQLTQYRRDGFPEDKRFNGKKALAEASVIVREHTPLTNLFMCLWFNEVVRFTSRDQLSFPYVLWRLRVLKNINMFPVCTRKALVNSMGHKRKAKPSIS
ncbi:hypothetical protein F0562_028617 [Nyssa sinensis]|uniref:TOD1/MUCI70 glycosyltransferase-like domain-containing protein n=1 Tax=Nyssa sinensis TaxID=561372 RepID=A0A5J5B0H0_9ASTE|nr:hypothetical protein F0562_028617 [Nyssa sinensis]